MLLISFFSFKHSLSAFTCVGKPLSFCYLQSTFPVITFLHGRDLYVCCCLVSPAFKNSTPLSPGQYVLLRNPLLVLLELYHMWFAFLFHPSRVLLTLIFSPGITMFRLNFSRNTWPLYNQICKSFLRFGFFSTISLYKFLIPLILSYPSWGLILILSSKA